MASTTTLAQPAPRSLAQRVLGSRLLASMTAPHGVDRYLEVVNPMWAAREVRARVVDRVYETRAGAPVATLTLQPTDTWAGFTAGQHVQVGVELPGGRRTTRVFSISSGQSGPGEPFTITMRANPDGLVSRHLVEAEPGTLLHLSQAEGDFVLPDAMPERLLLLSGGSGITPVMSMLRTLRGRHDRPRVTFVHHAQSAEHQIFARELAEYVDQDWVDLHLFHGDLFSADGLAAVLPDHADVPTWACGPAAMIDLVQQAYDGRDTLHVEFFKTPLATTGTVEGEVSFTRSSAPGATTAPNTGATLLEQAEALGLTPEFGCRMGICFTCTARKSEGTVRHVVTGAESSLPDEDIQICVHAPVGDCTVDL